LREGRKDKKHQLKHVEANNKGEAAQQAMR
jgi:hypothetical protein